MDLLWHGRKPFNKKRCLEIKSSINRYFTGCDAVTSWLARLSMVLHKKPRKEQSILTVHVLSILLLACIPPIASGEQSHESVTRVTNNPAIEVTKKDRLISLSAEQADLRDVFAALSEISGTPITVVDLDRKVEVSISFKGKTLAAALELLKQKLSTGGLVIMNAENQPGAADEINHVYVHVKKGRAGEVGDVYESAGPVNKSAPKIGNAERLSVANDALRLLVPHTVNIKTDVVRIVENNQPKIYLRHKMDWIEFGEVVTLNQGFSEVAGSSKAKQEMISLMRDKISTGKLDKPIITYSMAAKKLKECQPSMVVSVGKLRPPFFNNRTGIRWDSEPDVLVLEANDIVDEAANQCVRGILDLRNANLICSSMACKSY